MLAGELAPPVWESVIAHWFVFAAWPLAISISGAVSAQSGSRLAGSVQGLR
jgi:hypothetical protein